MADVAAGGDGEVAADGAGLRVQGVGGTQQDTAGLDGINALPDHGDNGAAEHVLDQAGEEGLLLQVGVVALQVLLGGRDELEGHQLVAALLEAADDGADQAALDAVGLDSNEAMLLACVVVCRLSFESVVCLQLVFNCCLVFACIFRDPGDDLTMQARPAP